MFGYFGCTSSGNDIVVASTLRSSKISVDGDCNQETRLFLGSKDMFHLQFPDSILLKTET